MATKPRDLVVRFLSDVAGFVRGTTAVSDALDDVVRDQQRLEREGDATARSLAQAYDRASDSIKRDARETKRVTSQTLGDAGKEAGDEFAQNLGESISGGDISGLLSGTVGGLVGTFGKGGPIALALGALGAVGVGAFTAIQESAKQATAAANRAFEDLHEGVTREAKLNNILTDRFGGLVEGWEAIQRYADASGVSVEAVADAIAEGGSKARTLADQWDRQLRTQYETEGTIDRTNSILIDGIDDLRDRADAMDRAARAAKTERDALAVSEGILRRSAAYYSARGSAYAPGGSTYNSQVPTYGSGRR